MVKRTYVAITEEIEDCGGRLEHSHIVEAEDDPEQILLALMEQHGLSFELKDYDTKIFEISREWSGPELLKLAHLKIDYDYRLVPEDTPEKPMKIIPLEPIMSVARSFKEEDQDE